MILKQGKKAKIEKVASISNKGKLNNITYFILYCNNEKRDVFYNIVDAIKKFNDIEKY